MVSVRVVTSNRTVLGEAPHWDEEQNVLYYVDILGKEVFKFDPVTKKQTSLKLGDTVSYIVPVKGAKDKFAISVGRNMAVLTWDGESDKPGALEILATVDDEVGKRANQLNDGKADASGRLWTGTLCFEPGFKLKEKNASFYSYSREKKVTKHLSVVSTSNGMAWNKDQKTMYYIDSLTKQVVAFDFDLQAGTITNKRITFDFTANGVPGIPDGMTIDTNDKLWVACAFGSRVIQVDPASGEILQTIPFSCSLISSVAFGGKNLDELYVTSGTMGMSNEERAKYPSAGCTFVVTGTGAKGLPMYRADL